MKKGHCTKHNTRRPCYACGQEAKRRAQALNDIGRDGSVVTKLRRLLVQYGMVAPEDRESIFRACAMMEKRAPGR